MKRDTPSPERNSAEIAYFRILNYGREVWAMNQKNQVPVQAAEMKFLRAVAEVTLLDSCLPNTTMRGDLQAETLLSG